MSQVGQYHRLASYLVCPRNQPQPICRSTHFIAISGSPANASVTAAALCVSHPDHNHRLDNASVNGISTDGTTRHEVLRPENDLLHSLDGEDAIRGCTRYQNTSGVHSSTSHFFFFILNLWRSIVNI